MDKSKEIEEHYDKIYRYCYYRLQHRETAEDVTQETFLRFYLKNYGRQGENPLKVMYTIARNLCVDEARRKKPLPLDVAGDACHGSMEEDILTGRLLKDAMQRLGEKERDIVFMRVVNEEPLAVIGETMQLSRYAVYRRYRHALRQLRKELEDSL